MNIIDKAIATISPQAGLKRAKARAMLEMVNGISTRRYEGAGTGRRFDGWLFKSKNSANSVIKKDLISLRDRSRDLVRNNPYAARARMVITSNTIGQGIIPQATHADPKKVDRAEELWKNWGETTYCDFEGRHDFYGIQALAMSSIFESGEVLIRRVFVKPKDRKAELNIKLQVLEPDFIDSDKEGKTDSDGSIIQGVEFDKDGNRVAYWLFDEHPGGSVTGKEVGESKRIDASEILHIFRVDRPGQFRGVPWLAPVMVRLKDFDDYEDAQIVRQKIAACFAAFVTTKDSETKPKSGDDLIDKLEPGIVQEMGEDQTVTFGNPPSVEGYADFVRITLQAVASALGITYESLVTDLSNVNFSSGRMGWLEFNRNLKSWRSQMIIPSLCFGIWAWFIESASLTGTDLSDVGATFTEPRREQIDPVKENEGDLTAVRMGKKSLSSVIREGGEDPKAVFKEIAEERAELKKLGLVFSSDAGNVNEKGLATATANSNGVTA